MGSQLSLAPALGWFGIALGAIEILAPDRLARVIGTRDHSMLVRAFGVREIAAGVSVLSRKDPVEGMWMRVGGDVLDLAALAMSLRSDRNDRVRLGAAVAAVAAVTAADVYAAVAASAQRSRRPQHPALTKTVSMMVRPETLHERLRDPSWLLKYVPGLGKARIEVADSAPESSLRYRVGGLPGGFEVILEATLYDQGVDRGTALRMAALPDTKGTGGAARLVRALAEVPGDALAVGLHRLKNIVEVGEVISNDGPSGHRLAVKGEARS